MDLIKILMKKPSQLRYIPHRTMMEEKLEKALTSESIFATGLSRKKIMDRPVTMTFLVEHGASWDKTKEPSQLRYILHRTMIEEKLERAL